MLTLFIYVPNDNVALKQFYLNRADEHNNKAPDKYADSGFDLGMPDHKIITDYDKATLLANVEKLDNSLHKMIYALYTMLPPRRLEYTNVKLISLSHRYKMTNDNNYLLMN